MKIQFFNNPILIIFILLNIINASSDQINPCGDLKDCRPCNSTENSDFVLFVMVNIFPFLMAFYVLHAMIHYMDK